MADSGDFLGQRRSVRVNAGRPPSRLGFPRSRDSSSEANEDLSDASSVTHARTFGQPSSLSPITSATLRTIHASRLSFRDNNSASMSRRQLEGARELEAEMTRLDEEHLAELERIRVSSEIRMAQARLENARLRAQRRFDSLLSDTSNARLSSSHSRPPTAAAGGAGGRLAAAEPVPRFIPAPPPEVLNNFLRTFHAPGELQPLIDDLQNYENSGRKLPPVHLDRPVMSSTPVSTPPPPQSGLAASDIANGIVQGLASIFPRLTAPSTVAAPSDGVAHEFLKRQTVAKDLPIFSGAPEEWLAFITQFHETNKICKFQNFENLSRLQKCLKGRAGDAVLPILNLADNVPEIIKSLEENFGQPQHIIMHLINKAKNATAPRSGRPDTVVSFSNVVKNMIMTMKALKCYNHLANPELLRELAMKLPDNMQVQWCRASIHFAGNADLTHFSTWLSEQSKIASLHSLLKPSAPDERDRDRGENRRGDKRAHQGTVFHAGEKKPKLNGVKKACILCNEDTHGIQRCSKFLDLDSAARWNLVLEKKLCFRCLAPGHRMPDCRSKSTCAVAGCPKPNHHTLLHRAKPEGAQNGVVVHVSEPIASKVLLRMIPVTLFGPHGEVRVFALLDEGSTMTLMEAKLSEQLGLTGPIQSLCMQWTHDVVRHDSKSQRVAVGISGISSGSTKFHMNNVRTVSEMRLPAQSVDMTEITALWPYLKNIPFKSYSNMRPQIIIGHDNFLLTTPRKVIHSTWGTPIATRTWLGWTIHGSQPALGNIEPAFTMHICDHPEMDLISLHNMVKESFSIENMGVRVTNPTSASKQDMRAQKILDATTVRVGDRWQTGLLWRSDEFITSDSKPVALKRLACLENRMDQDSNFASGYCAKMDDLLGKGYVRKLTSHEVAIRQPYEWYLPHFGVVNPNKPGKLRLVFDLAAKSRGVSLNNYLLTGPDLLLSIVAVLWRFRKYKFAFASDIKEMFLRFLIPENEIHAQRFFWRGMDRQTEPDVYVVVVVCFGATSSPCNANYVKLKNAAEFEKEFPEANRMVKFQSYMDDYMGGGDTEAETSKLIHDLVEVHKRGAMELCNWTANSKVILNSIPSALKAAGVKDLSPDSEIPVERVLGMYWNPEHDFFTYKLNFHKVSAEIKNGTQTPTKRQILQLVMSVFDPLGFLTFFVIKARILLQDVWREVLQWDQKISGELEVRWKKWVLELQAITQVRIPRFYSAYLKTAKSVQLHVFCDASEQAYAAVAYLRIESPEGAIDVALLGAKGRVAPLKKLSIPRLELQAALVAARLAVAITRELQVIFTRNVFWSDSMTVLGWLRTESRRLNQYVANRVGEILESTNVHDWRWILTKENVADEATRDNKPCEFSETCRWFAGPTFLKSSEEAWPITEPITNKNKKQEEVHYVGVIIDAKSHLPDIMKFSSYTKLMRVTAWILRFVAFCRDKDRKTKFSKCLTVDELKDAELLWLKRTQADSFDFELNCLLSDKSILNSSKLSSLSPILNDQGLIVLKGRIDNAAFLDQSVKRPIFLDTNHPLTKLLVTKYHVNTNHQGQETVINEIRQRFWILQVRKAVKYSFRNCQYCRNLKCLPIIPEMGQLPEFRFLKKVRPFSYCGLDYFGPLAIKIGKRQEKRYGVIFSCMSTRAVHLELAGSLTTDSAVNAVRRFIGRRGQPHQILTDNGTNFKGAATDLQKAIIALNKSKLVDSTSTKGITWKFLPPASPHMGGSWERLIRSVKTALKSVLKENIPTEETLFTLLVEVEHIVNSRPLTQVSIDPNDIESLIANHFLLGNSSGAPSPGILTEAKDLKKQWRYTQVLTDQFCQRWVKEYLPTLARRTKWTSKTEPLQVGDVVVIADDKGPRNSWPLGRIVSVYPGKDGQVRVADVKTKDGTFRRPVVKLCKLDVNPRNKEN